MAIEFTSPEERDYSELGAVIVKVEFNGKDFQLGRLLFDQQFGMPDVMRGLAEYLRLLASNIDFSTEAQGEIEALLSGLTEDE